jgi:ATP-dependent DNA helicase RecG
MEQTTDGFDLAEADLDLRGEGTVRGSCRKGRGDLKLASLRKDRDLVRFARAAASEIVESDPLLAASPQIADELRLLVGEEGAEYLGRS